MNSSRRQFLRPGRRRSGHRLSSNATAADVYVPFQRENHLA